MKQCTVMWTESIYILNRAEILLSSSALLLKSVIFHLFINHSFSHRQPVTTWMFHLCSKNAPSIIFIWPADTQERSVWKTQQSSISGVQHKSWPCDQTKVCLAKVQRDYHTQTVTISYFQSKITLKLLEKSNTWHGPNSNLHTIPPMKYVRLTLACPKSYDFENKKEYWHRMVKMWTFLNLIASQFYH